MSSTHSPPLSPPQSRASDLGSLKSRKSARERRILQSGEDRINRILSSTPNLPSKVGEEPNSPPIESEQLSSSDRNIKKRSLRGSRGRVSGRRIVPVDQSSVLKDENNGLNLADISSSEPKKTNSRPITPIQDNVQRIETPQVNQQKPQLPTGLEGLEKLSLLFERMQQQSGNSSTPPMQLEGLLDNIDRSETMSPFNNLFTQTEATQPSVDIGTHTKPQSNNYLVQFLVGILLVLYLLFITPAIMDNSNSVTEPSQVTNNQSQYLQLTKYLSFSQIKPFYLLLSFSIINQTYKLIKHKNERGSKFQHYPPPLKDIAANLSIAFQLATGMWDDFTLVIFVLGHLTAVQSIIISLL